MDGPLFVLYFSKLLLVLIVFSFLGKIIFPQRPVAPFYNAFFNTLLSLILFSTIFALSKANGMSVMWGFIIWLILWYVYRKKSDFFLLFNRPFYISISPRYLYRTGSLFLGLLGIFAWAYFGKIQGSDFPFIIPLGTALAPNDINIYALRSYYLGVTGHENYFGIYNTFDPNFHGPKPYHYLELWFNAGMNWLFGGLNVLNLSLITGPVLKAISLLGILALWERFTMVRWFHILIAFAMLWLGGLYLFYDKIGFPAFGMPIITYRFKMVAYYPFLLGFALCFAYEEWKRGVLLLLGLPLATIVAGPAIAGGLTLFLIGYWIFAKAQKFPLAYTFFTLILFFGSISIFYILNGQSSTGTTFELGQSEIVGSFHVKEILNKTPLYLKYFLYAIVHILVLYIPYFLLAYLFRHYIFIALKKSSLFFILSTCIIITGAFVWSILHDYAQSAQLYYNMSVPLMNVMGILLIIIIAREYGIRLYKKKGLIAAGVIFLIIAVQFYSIGKVQFKERGKQNYSIEYLQKIDSIVQNGQISAIGAAIKGPEDYQSEYSKMVAGYTLGYYLQYMKNGHSTVSLSDFEVPINPNDRRNNLKDIQSGAFYQFVIRQKDNGMFKSVEQSQLDFLRKNHINFLIVSANGEIPEILAKYINQEFRDSLSGERFFLLGNMVD